MNSEVVFWLAIGACVVGFIAGACYGERYGRDCESQIADKILQLAFLKGIISEPQRWAIARLYRGERDG